MKKRSKMKIYAASNFILLRYIEKEKLFREKITEQYGYCGRLYSFFFKKENQRVYDLMDKEIAESECDDSLHHNHGESKSGS